MFVDMPPCPVGPVVTKVCSRCSVEKSLNDFHVHRLGRLGKRARCKNCQKESNRPWTKANTERVNAYGRKWRKENPELAERTIIRYLETIDGRASMLWNAARGRRPEGFTLTKKHVAEGIARGKCPVSDFPFDMTARYRVKSDKSRSPYAPSIDRSDNSLGYTDANTVVVCSQINMMRGELSYDELRTFCRAILDRSSK